jgi:8-amino-7-oxononanoate synthase
MNLSDRWSSALTELGAQGLLRELSPAQGVDLCTNDYLGYASQGLPIDARAVDLGMLGRSGTASRLVRGELVWKLVEEKLARWHGAAAALMMTSGYAANEGLLSTVIEADDWVASDQFNHASIIDGLRLSRAERFIYRHADLNHLEDGLRAVSAQRSKSRQLFIVTESLFGMDGDLAPLREIVDLADRYQANVIVDEAHSTGCYGETGSGLVDMHRLRERVLATVHTGGKALGVMGAYICGSVQMREWLINRCRHFMFSTALPRTTAEWWLECIHCVRRDAAARESLHRLARVFRNALVRQSVTPVGTEYVVPIILRDNREAIYLANRMQIFGWDIRAIRPPTVPAGSTRIRISIHADHNESMLEEVAATTAAAIKIYQP